MDEVAAMSEVLESAKGQLGFDLGDAKPVAAYDPDRDEIRAELKEVLAAANAAADGEPWDQRALRYQKIVFPQMSRWLPDDEREQLCAAFSEAVERIEAIEAK